MLPLGINYNYIRDSFFFSFVTHDCSICCCLKNKQILYENLPFPPLVACDRVKYQLCRSSCFRRRRKKFFYAKRGLTALLNGQKEI